MSGLHGADDVNKLAAIGSHGNHPGNFHRDLLRLVGAPKVPEVYTVACPMTVKSDDGRYKQEMVDVNLLLPHEWFAALSSLDLLSHIVGSHRTPSFWADQHAQDPKIVGHPMLLQSGWRNSFVPLQLHGDGAPYQKRDSASILSFRSMLSDLHIESSMFLIAAIPYKCRVKGTRLNWETDTWHPIWKVLEWSFQALFDGRCLLLNFMCEFRF